MRKYLLLLAILLLAGCGPKTINYSAQQLALPQLVVQAQGQVAATPDQLQMRLGVITEAAQAGTALEQNNQRMNSMMQGLNQVGITDDELATGQFQIRPEWSRPPRPTPANWQREIVGYQVSNELLVTTTKVELAGKLLGLAQQAGANQIGGLQFGLADPTSEQQKAIEIATAKAIRKAETMAAAAGVKLGAIQSITLNPSFAAPQPRMMMAEASLASADSVPVTAGTVDVAATVKIVYQIMQ